MSEPSIAGPGRSMAEIPDYTLFGEVEMHAVDRLHQVMAARLTASWREVPHVTHFEEVDVTELEARRIRDRGTRDPRAPRVSLLAFVVHAVSEALGNFPDINASLSPDGRTLVRKAYRNIGIAVDTPVGLLVPVLHNVQDMDPAAITDGIAALAERARAGRLRNEDIEGGSFTVSNLGRLGGTAFTPIINAPEVAILGVARVQERVMRRSDRFVARRMLPLCLSYDHRVVDGAMAGRFLQAIRERLAALADVSGDGPLSS